MPVFRHLRHAAVAVTATAAPLAAQPSTLATPGGSGGPALHGYRSVGLSRPSLSVLPPKGPAASPWCHYYEDECMPWPLEQGFLTVLAPDGATSEEVGHYFRRLGEYSFTLAFQETEAVFSPDGSFKPAPMYVFRRERAHRPVEDLIAAGAKSGDNDWFWMPTFCLSESNLVVTLPHLVAKMNPGFGRADLEAAVAEENAGFVTGS